MDNISELGHPSAEFRLETGLLYSYAQILLEKVWLYLFFFPAVGSLVEIVSVHPL